ncbi:SUMF1/EgtB/PvdO family nonheme iron enzyme, partial [bacterium]|nr:SUMF1/EgtB/PvdO family nonheme iron enzyme [bacterium]
TEAQWEFAAQGGMNSPRYWGKDDSLLGEYENVLDLSAAEKVTRWRNAIKVKDGYFVTAPVGSYKPNPFGLHDMLGNVQEMCRDYFDPKYYQSQAASNPFNSKPTDRNALRVLRGGSWDCYRHEIRAAYRVGVRYNRGYEGIGFRLVREEN